MASRIKTYKPKKPRDWLALNAIRKTGAGAHTNKRRQTDKMACRGKVKEEE